jgi:hypothetical protein
VKEIVKFNPRDIITALQIAIDKEVESLKEDLTLKYAAEFNQGLIKVMSKVGIRVSNNPVFDRPWDTNINFTATIQTLDDSKATPQGGK